MASIKTTCKKLLGYEPRPAQYDVLKAWKNGKSVFAVLPTGGGKSACYQVPAAMSDGLVIVFSPLIALMKDQVERAEKLGIRAAAIASDRDDEDNRRTMRDLSSGRLRMLFVAPERTKNKGFMEAVARAKVSLVALDEAHCITRWGRDFRPAYSDLPRFIRQFPGVPVMALTATADKDVEADVAKAIGFSGYRRIVARPRRPNLKYTSVVDLDETAIPRIVRSADEGTKVIYCSSRKECDRLAMLLRSFGMKSESYHAGLDPKKRSEVQDDFKDGRLECVVATNAFGMGVDVPNIRLVLHWHLPDSIFSYVQEAGRASRDGKPARCILNVSKKGRQLREHFIRNTNPVLTIYERLWSFINSKIAVGEVLRTSETVLCRSARLPDVLKGQAMAALHFMEYNKLLSTKPGKKVYKLRVRTLHMARMWEKRLPDAEVTNGMLVYRMDPDESDPYEQIVESSACWPGEPQTEIMVKRLRTAMTITDEDIDAKTAHDMDKLRTLLKFAGTPDSRKPDFIDQQFLA